MGQDNKRRGRPPREEARQYQILAGVRWYRTARRALRQLLLVDMGSARPVHPGLTAWLGGPRHRNLSPRFQKNSLREKFQAVFHFQSLRIVAGFSFLLLKGQGLVRAGPARKPYTTQMSIFCLEFIGQNPILYVWVMFILYTNRPPTTTKSA